MEERLKYHITLTDNETGEVIHDGDIEAIIGAFSTETRTAAIAKTSCSLRGLVATIVAAEDAIEHVIQGDDSGILELLLDLAKLENQMQSKEENKED